VAKEVESEVQAIRVQRQLLDEPDPVPPVVARVTEALREAIGEVTGQFTAEIELARERLMATDTWDQLDDPSRVEILDRYQFNLPKQPDLSTDEALLRVLDEAPLRIWPDRIAAIGARSQQAALAAARAIEPKVKSVTLPSRTLRNANDVDTYVECVRQVLMAQIDDGPLVVG
jgi:hypothetical protein